MPSRRLALLLLLLLVPAFPLDAATSAKLTIVALEGPGGTFTSQLPPSQFVIQKALPWATVPGGFEPPLQEFGIPQPSVLTTSLHFDNHEVGGDVAAFLQPLEAMASVSLLWAARRWWPCSTGR